MGEKIIPTRRNAVLKFLHDIKEYVLVLATLLAIILYFNHYVLEIAKEIEPNIQWVIYFTLLIVIISLYFFSLKPVLQKRKELNLRPKGNPDTQYFTTSPRTEDSYNFFQSGYDKYLKWLINNKTPLLYLTGPSGSGKTSLINAYLTPQLEHVSGSSIKVYTLRSHHDPLQELYTLFTGKENQNFQIEAATVFALINKERQRFFKSEKTLIVFDQFEEFFLLRNEPDIPLSESKANDEKENLKKFFHLFIAKPPTDIYILLSYRDDFQQHVDEFELPSRIENVNFKQTRLLTLHESATFLKNCPGLKIPKEQLNRIIWEATSIDSPLAIRPIVLNLLGIILQNMISQKDLPKKEGNLIRQYINDCLGKELKQERTTVLKEMLTDFNTAKPRTINELIKKSDLTITQLDNQMLSLQRHGIVRCLDSYEVLQGQRKWQISHDFVASQLEKVIHQRNVSLWSRLKKWISPVLMFVVIIISVMYYGNLGDWKTRQSIKRLNRSEFVWNEQTRTLTSSNPVLNDSLLQILLPDIIKLKPDSLVIICNEFDSTKQISDLKGVNKVKTLWKLVLENNSKIKNLDDLKYLPQLNKLALYRFSKLENLDGIKDLHNLKYIVLSGCPRVKSIEGLSMLDSIKVLSVYDCDEIEDISPLRNLKKMEILNLQFGHRLRNIDALGELKGLKYLSLTACDSLTSIDGIKNSLSIKSLDLNQCQLLENIDPLQNLISLERLDLTNCDQIKNLDPLRKLKSLKEIAFNGCHKLKNIDGLTDLRNLANTKELNLTECRRLKNLNGLINCSEMVELKLNFCDDLANISGISNMRKLTSVDFLNCISLTDISVLKDLKSLNDLSFAQCDNLENIEVISQLPNLKRLDLRSCEKIRTLEPIYSLKSLEYLNLANSISMKNLQFLKIIPSLTKLDISYNKQLIELSGIDKFQNLIEIDLNNCKNLEKIDDLYKLRKLKKIDLTGDTKITKEQYEDLKRNLPETYIIYQKP